MQNSTQSIEEIQVQLTQKIYENFPLAENLGLTAEQNMLECGAVDSLGILVISDLLETDFGCSVQDDEVVEENFATIGALARMIVRKRG